MRCVYYSLLVFCLLLSTACADRAPTDRVVIDGSSTVFPLSEAVAHEFMKTRREVPVTVAFSGTGAGFGRFCRGQLDIADASRPITPEEQKLCETNNVTFIELPVAHDAVTVIVNAKNSWASSITQDFRTMDADFGLSAYHQPYNNTTSVVWDLPFTGPFGGGWQLAAINSIYSGEPVTFTYTATGAFIVSGINQDFRGANTYRLNVIGDPYAPEDQRTVQNWFNRNNVVIPTDPSQPFSNAARNSVRGPVFWQMDLAVSRRVPMPWPSGALELRAEFFNLFNRTNFRAPNGNRSQAAFGTITQTYDPRQAQLGIKLLF